MKNTFRKLLVLAMVGVMTVSATSVTSQAAGATETAKEKVTRLAIENARPLTAEETRALSELFVAEQYAKMYPDVANTLGNDPKQLWNHFIALGLWERRQPCYGLNIDVFASDAQDLQKLYGPDMVSYYVYYANNRGACQLYRPAPTLNRAVSVGNYVYCVYDFVKGEVGPKEGAWPVISPNDHAGIATYAEIDTPATPAED